MKWSKDNVKNFWKGYVGREDEFQGERVSKEIVRLSKKYIGKKVLDVGAGTGALIRLIPSAIGIDIVARPGIIEGDITKLPFEDESFDTVFSTEVLEHLTDLDLKKSVSEVYRVLKKGGYFIVTVPYDEDLRERMVKCPNCGEEFHSMQHFQSFNKESIKKVLKNFKLIKISREPYDFRRKIMGFLVSYRHVKIFKPLLNLMKKGNLFVVVQKE